METITIKDKLIILLILIFTILIPGIIGINRVGY